MLLISIYFLKTSQTVTPKYVTTIKKYMCIQFMNTGTQALRMQREGKIQSTERGLAKLRENMSL